MKCLAGIVTYNPDINRLSENIRAIENQVDEVLIVDNGSDNIDQFSNMAKTISLHKNKGIAFALNKIGEYAIDYHYEWFLTLDQDTVVMKNLIDTYKNYITLPKAGMLTTLFKDRNRAQSNILIFEDTAYREVDTAITSATFMNTESFKKTEGFDDKMFIDLVDFDMNYKMRQKGYRIYQISMVGFLHEIGETKERKFLGLKHILVFNHSPFRRYYFARNSIYMYKKYHTLTYINKTLLEFIKIVLYEKKKIKKVTAILRGIVDGFKMKVE